MTASGSSTINIDVSTNVLVFDSSSTIEVADGDLTINANQGGGTPIDQNFNGVLIVGTVRTTGDGDVAITGTGGSSATDGGYGIELRSTGKVRSTSTAATAGSLTLIGNGGASSSGSLTYGITLSSA